MTEASGQRTADRSRGATDGGGRQLTGAAGRPIEGEIPGAR